MRKDNCPECKGLKDKRASLCKTCSMKFNHPRKNTGKGWVITSAGYIAGFFNGKYCYQHREVMSYYIGRPLMEDEVVHHVDNNKSNNSIHNLKLMKLSDHHKFHMSCGKAKAMSERGHFVRWRYV